MSEESFQFYTRRNANKVTFGLVQLKPGEDPSVVATAIRDRIPPDTRVFTRAEILEYERAYWLKRTAVGQFFYFGVVLAFAVGAIFIYQMMVADIKKHLPEYATLKAMGYEFPFLFRMVMWQAVAMTVIGYLLGLAIALGSYELTHELARLPINMTVERIAIVFLLTLFMCIGSGFLAVRKVRTADPASLF